jgi:O-antigen/teichoic acid export membrane protein
VSVGTAGGIESRVVRNSAWLLAGEVLGRALGALWQILLARYLGTLLFGEFSFALALTAIVGVLADFGLGTLVTREVARNPEEPRRALRGALHARALLTLLLGGLAIAGTALADRSPRVITLVAILAAGQLVMGQGELLAAAHRGREQMRRPVLVSLLYRVGLVSSGAAAMALGASVLDLAWLLSAWAVSLLLLFRGLPRTGTPEAATTMLRRAAPIGLGLVLWTLYFRSNVLLVSLFRGDEEAGVFAAPFRLVEAVLLLSGPLIAAAFPVLSRRRPRDPEYRRVFRGVLHTLLYLGIPASVLLAVEAPTVLRLVYGADFLPGAGALLFLAGMIPLSFVAGPFLAALIAGNREGAYLFIMSAGVVVNLALAVGLIPRLGATGAGMAMLLTEAVVFSLALLKADRTDEVRRILQLMVSVILAVVYCMMLLLWLGRLGVPFGARVAALLVVHPLLMWVLGLATPARILLLFRTLLRRE